MNSTYSVSIFALITMALTLVIPISIFIKLQVKLTKSTLIACTRMILQLLMVGLYLKYLFLLKNPFVNCLYIAIMLFIATSSVISRSKLSFKAIFKSLASAYFLSIFAMLAIFTIIFDTEILKNTRYIIPLSGMLLGNLLKGNVVAISSFWDSLKKEQNYYIHNIMLGATHLEAVLPFFKKSFILAVQPQIAGLATLGLVALPGMMTGQLLGGANPISAIKYQILIMLAIFVTLCLSVFLSIYFTMQAGIDKYGKINHKIYKEKK